MPGLRSLTSATFTLALMGFLGTLSGISALAQTDDFNDGNTTGWLHYDLTSAGLPAGLVQYSFPDDGNGGKAFRMKCLAPPIPDAGPARAFFFFGGDPYTYTRFTSAVDLIAADLNASQAFGLGGMVGEPGPGTTDGYVMNYHASDQSLEINIVQDEGNNNVADADLAVDFNDGKRYRLVFSGFDGNLLGQMFQLPDTNNPLASVFTYDANFLSGYSGLFIFSDVSSANYTASTSIADATFDNYAASTVAANGFEATTVQLVPKPGGNATTTAMKAGILDRETSVDSSTIGIWVDGVKLAASDLTVEWGVTMPGKTLAYSGATVSFTFPVTGALSAGHTNRLVYQDSAGTWKTNEWSYTFSYLQAANAAPTNAGLNPGFSVRLVQTLTNVSMENSLTRAEKQLATPAQIPVDMTVTTNASIIDFTQNAETDSQGHVAGAAALPGIDPAGNTDNMAMEITAYLLLPKGKTTFGVRSDDGFQMRSGASLTDTNALVLGQKFSGTYDGTFDVIAEKTGLYPVRLVWFESGGGAYIELYTMDELGNAIAVNDEASPIKAYQSLVAPEVVLECTSNLGVVPFAVESKAVVDTQAKTITVPASGNGCFYRIKNSSAVKIQQIRVSNGQVVIQY